MKNIFLKGSLAAGALLLLFPQGQSHAAVNSYEVKVYADADKIVKDNRHIDHDILNQLGSEDKDEDFNVQYIDDGIVRIITTRRRSVCVSLKMKILRSCSIRSVIRLRMEMRMLQ